MMGLLRRFEKGLERIFEGPFNRVFKSGVHPLEIARRLVREIEDGKALGISGTVAPNRYRVYLSAEDYQRLSGYLGRLGSELESLAITYTNDRGYHLETRPSLAFEPDAGLKEGEFVIRVSLEEPASRKPPAPAWPDEAAGQPSARAGMLAVLRGEQAGSSFLIAEPRVSIGRSEDNDLVLADPRVSRYHAQIERTPGGYVLRDLESTNGTLVKGRRVKERLLEDGDILVMGGTEMRFSLV